MACAYIYGDSLLKATVPDEQFRYHFHLPEVMERYSGRQSWRRKWALGAADAAPAEGQGRAAGAYDPAAH